jgi:hypothetical protein
VGISLQKKRNEPQKKRVRNENHLAVVAAIYKSICCQMLPDNFHLAVVAAAYKLRCCHYCQMLPEQKHVATNCNSPVLPLLPDDFHF